MEIGWVVTETIKFMWGRVSFTLCNPYGKIQNGVFAILEVKLNFPGREKEQISLACSRSETSLATLFVSVSQRLCSLYNVLDAT